MSHGDWFILIGMGGLFILLGIAALIRGKKEEKSYYNSISTRHDAREFLEHDPERPKPGALKIGGWIAMAIGLLMLVMGGAFLLWG
jgi:multisubunit Na+/H+ antiporter MnhB subunit